MKKTGMTGMQQQMDAQKKLPMMRQSTVRDTMKALGGTSLKNSKITRRSGYTPTGQNNT